MKLVGKFLITLSDGVIMHHPNGGWCVNRDGRAVTRSIDHPEWSDDHSPVKGRLQPVEGGDSLIAFSATGKTGAEGVILSRAGNQLIVIGEAWGPSHAAYGPRNMVTFRTDTFVVSGLEAVYSGSLPGLSGARADHRLVQRIEEILFERATA
jgi:hypothetical protein